MLIIYQNGKKEFFTSAAQTTSAPVQKIEQTAAVRPNTSLEDLQKDPRYAFTPRDKNKPKDKTNFADRFGNIGVSLNTIGKTTIPSISIINDFFFMPNVAFSFGINGSYHSEEIMDTQ